jgi:serine/threonine-protein kinase
MPDKIGRYEIIKTIGQGAMGLVYMAKDPAIDRTVAIKTIREDSNLFAKDAEEVKKRFRREAQVAGRLSHPGIVTIYDVGGEGGLFYIVMEYVEGDTLDKIVDSKHLPDVDKTIDLMLQVCDAIGYAHKSGIIHRDIKPANIMIVDKRYVKVMDFGIARIASSDMTQVGKIMGTPNYMSPEQVMGAKVDNRTDIFSMGVILYELLTGEKAFPGESITTVIYRILHENPTPPKKLRLQLPSSLDYIVNKAMSKEIEKRYQSMEEFAKDLRNYKTLEQPKELKTAKPEAEAEDTLSMSTMGNAPAAEKRAELKKPESAKHAKQKEISKQPNTGYMIIGALLLAILVGAGLFYLKSRPGPVIKEEKKDIQPAALPPANIPEKVEPPKPVEPVAAKNGSISVRSRPKARIFINGKPAGTTPNEITNLPVGEYNVALKHDDFPEWATQVSVQENKTTEVGHSFIKKEVKKEGFGALMINAQPWGVVYLDDKEIGSTPITVPKVPEGLHKVRVVRDGFKELMVEVKVAPNKKNNLSLKLEKK